MNELIEYFRARTPIPTEIDQKVIDIQAYTKINSKLFMNCIDEDANMVSVETFMASLPKNANRILLESAYRKLLDYDRGNMQRLLKLKFIDRNRKVSQIFNSVMFHIFYVYSNFHYKKEKVLKPVIFNFNYSWNEDQLHFIEMPLCHCKLVACPGSGKTTSIVGKIKYLIYNKIIEADGFIVLAFSKNAVEDFNAKLNNQSLKDRVRTIHSLAGYILTILSKSVKTTTQSIDTCVYKSTMLLKNTYSDLTTLNYFKNVKCIFIDEAQDISRVQFEFIELVAKKLSASLIMVGDPNQSIYKFQNGSDEFINNFNGERIELVKNYRSTLEIVEVINRACPNERLKPMESVNGYSGIKPQLFIGKMDDILIEIENYFQYPFNDVVAIIGPVKKSRPNGDSYINIGLNTIVNYFEKKNIKYNKCFDDSEVIELSQKKKLSIKSGIINLLTIHGAKGLEFDRVVLINYHFSTFTKVPKVKVDYDDIKYLWYVGLSRAKKDLRIFSLEDKWIWPEHVHYEDYVICNKKIKYPTLKFSNEQQHFYSWSEIISNRKIFSESFIAEIQDEVPLTFVQNSNYDCNEITMEYYKDFMNSYLILENCPNLRRALIENYNNRPSDIKDFDDFSILYGYWAEETFYHAYRNEFPPKLIELVKMCNTSIQMENKFSFQIKKIIKENGSKIISWSFFEQYKKKCGDKEFLSVIESFKNKEDHFFLYIENEEQYYCHSELSDKVEYFLDKKLLDINDIFYICLFHYQYSYEMKHLMFHDFSEHIQSLTKFDKMIRKIAKGYPDGYTFQEKIKSEILPISGVMDAINKNENKILEIKFSESREPKWIYMFQVLGYAEFYYSRNIKKCTIEILNLYHFCSFEINRGKYNRYSFYHLIAEAIKCKLSNCCWIYDLETTGLIDKHFPKIMEIHVEELSTGIVPLSTLVKVNNYKYDDQGIQNFNGISRSMCNKFGIEEIEVAKDIEHILKNSDCKFIAHNGNHFDHKIIRNIINKDVLFPTLDTLCIFPLFIEEKLESKKLTKIYEHIFGFEYKGRAHRAEADVKIMIEILLKLGITSKLLTEISN